MGKVDNDQDDFIDVSKIRKIDVDNTLEENMVSVFKKRNNYRPSGRVIRRSYSSRAGLGGRDFKRREHFWQRRRFKLMGIAVAVAAILLAYWLLWSGFLRITTVEVRGAQTIDPAQIEQVVRQQFNNYRGLLFSQSHLLFFDASEITQQLQQQYFLDRVVIKRRPLHRLIVEITEKTAQLTWVSDRRYYTIDGNGLALREIIAPSVVELAAGQQPTETAAGEQVIDSNVLGQSGVVVVDQNNDAITIGQSVASEQFVRFIAELIQKFPSTDLTAEQWLIPSVSEGIIHVKTTRGFMVYFDSQDPLDAQLANLRLILREKIKDRSINYIDLRFGNRVFIK